jgi:hypothetical protein
MAYTARKLIAKAYNLSGIVAKSLETLSGDELIDGLDLLNGILAVKSIDTRLIPYYQEYDFSTVAAQEKYFIPNLLQVESFTFNIGDVRYSSTPLQRKRYFASPRVDSIVSLPYSHHVERVKGGSNLYLYFLPNQNYQLRIWGKFGFLSVPDENFDLETAYDDFFIEYLKFALAEYICADYNIQFQPQSMQKLKDLEYTLIDISPKDYSTQKLSTLQYDTSINYGDANIGKGLRP